jgi:quercetin 2,3-dioxygenase
MTVRPRLRTVRRLFSAPKQREGGGFIVRRSVGSQQMSVMDPFLMLDHMGPTNYGPGEAVGAPDHPHRGFETVTYVLQGGFHHQDNAGNEVRRAGAARGCSSLSSVGRQGWLRPGWVQWMTAGSGGTSI